jgi:hypothetical protein
VFFDLIVLSLRVMFSVVEFIYSFLRACRAMSHLNCYHSIMVQYLDIGTTTSEIRIVVEKNNCIPYTSYDAQALCGKYGLM